MQGIESFGAVKPAGSIQRDSARYSSGIHPDISSPTRDMIAGGFDYLLKVRVPDMAAYRRFLGDRVSTMPGVSRTHTYFVMEEIKATQELPIGTPAAP